MKAKKVLPLVILILVVLLYLIGSNILRSNHNLAKILNLSELEKITSIELEYPLHNSNIITSTEKSTINSIYNYLIKYDGKSFSQNKVIVASSDIAYGIKFKSDDLELEITIIDNKYFKLVKYNNATRKLEELNILIQEEVDHEVIKSKF